MPADDSVEQKPLALTPFALAVLTATGLNGVARKDPESASGLVWAGLIG